MSEWGVLEAKLGVDLGTNFANQFLEFKIIKPAHEITLDSVFVADFWCYDSSHITKKYSARKKAKDNAMKSLRLISCRLQVKRYFKSIRTNLKGFKMNFYG